METNELTREVIGAAMRVHSSGYRADVVVDNLVIVELKAVARTTPVHEAQLLSYLRLSGRPVGLLINFHVKHLRHGLKRVVNGFRE